MRSSRLRRLKSASHIERSLANISHFLLRCVHRCTDGIDQAIPARRLFAQSLPPGGSQAVESGLALVFAFAPVRCDQALMLQTVECGIEGTLSDLQGILRNLLNPQEHAITVQRPE